MIVVMVDVIVVDDVMVDVIVVDDVMVVADVMVVVDVMVDVMLGVVMEESDVVVERHWLRRGFFVLRLLLLHVPER